MAVPSGHGGVLPVPPPAGWRTRVAEQPGPRRRSDDHRIRTAVVGMPAGRHRCRRTGYGSLGLTGACSPAGDRTRDRSKPPTDPQDNGDSRAAASAAGADRHRRNLVFPVSTALAVAVSGAVDGAMAVAEETVLGSNALRACTRNSGRCRASQQSRECVENASCMVCPVLPGGRFAQGVMRCCRTLRLCRGTAVLPRPARGNRLGRGGGRCCPSQPRSWSPSRRPGWFPGSELLDDWAMAESG